MVIYFGCEQLGIQWVKVTLYVHLWEQITKRLHHGLSEMIVVNTLIDVRELKNECIKTKSSVYYDVDAPEYK